MKKLLLTFMFVSCICGFTLAQTEAGTMMIGGTGTVHVDIDDTDEKVAFLVLSPRIGFFVINNFAIGSAVPVIFSGSERFTNISVGLTPFMRVYMGSAASRFLLEARAGYNYSRYNDKVINFSASDKYFSYGGGIGYAHFINEHVGLEFLVSYDKTEDNLVDIDYSHLSGINLNVGFQIYLSPGSK